VVEDEELLVRLAKETLQDLGRFPRVTSREAWHARYASKAPSVATDSVRYSKNLVGTPQLS